MYISMTAPACFHPGFWSFGLWVAQIASFRKKPQLNPRPGVLGRERACRLDDRLTTC